jgi:hypothetical protein
VVLAAAAVATQRLAVSASGILPFVERSVAMHSLAPCECVARKKACILSATVASRLPLRFETSCELAEASVATWQLPCELAPTALMFVVVVLADVAAESVDFTHVAVGQGSALLQKVSSALSPSSNEVHEENPSSE